MRIPRTTALTFAAAALTLTSGCGQSASADPATPSISSTTVTPSTSSSHKSTTSSAPMTSTAASTKAAPESSTSSPAPVGVKIPDAAKAHTQAGAVAFVKYYYETLAALDENPRLGVIPALSMPSCVTCADQENKMKDDIQKHVKRKLDGPIKLSTEVSPKSVSDQVIVIAKHDISGYTTSDSSSPSPQTHKPEKLQTVVRVDWTKNGWRIGVIGARVA